MFCQLPVILTASPYVYDIRDRYRFLVHVVNSSSAKDLAEKISEVLHNYEVEKHNAILNREKMLKLMNGTPIEIKKMLDRLIQRNLRDDCTRA
jgi:glycosyltransferase involved in cell wall biosynthesis